jgi:hypothetical protein
MHESRVGQYAVRVPYSSFFGMTCQIQFPFITLQGAAIAEISFIISVRGGFDDELR